MKSNLFIAYRHLVARKFQTIMSILAIGISLTVFIVSLSVSNGLRSNLLSSILTLSPHIDINYDINFQQEGEYLSDIKELSKDKSIKSLRTIYETKGIAKTRNINAMIFFGTELDKVNLKLIDGKKGTKLTEVLVGSEYAKKENLKVGDKIRLIVENNKQIDVNISGIFKTGYYTYDSGVMIVPLETIQILMENGNKITSIGVDIEYPTDLKDLRNLTLKLQNQYPTHLVYNWTDMNQSLLSAIEFEKFVLVSILSFLVIIATFVIAVILNMIIREKTNDIGILKSFGYKSKKIRNIFLCEARIMAIIGILFSAILSPVIIKLLKYLFKNVVTNTYYIDKLPVSISFKEVLIIYILSYFLIILSTLIPTNRASKMKPNDAIKYNN